MRRILTLGVSVLLLTACNPKDAKKDAEKTEATQLNKNDTEILASLTKEQQAAVRILIRDTLVTDPNILLEAQQAYEAQSSRMANEHAAKSFETLVKDGSELSFGPKDAKITIIEFFDYKCGFCHAASPWLTNYMNAHKDVRVIFKELPILTANSLVAAKAAYASHAQGKYLDFHRALMKSQGDLNIDQIMQIATSVGIDTVKLQKDMEKKEIDAYLEKIQKQASDTGINGTPGFLINGKLVSGFNPQELDAVLGVEAEGK